MTIFEQPADSGLLAAGSIIVEAIIIGELEGGLVELKINHREQAIEEVERFYAYIITPNGMAASKPTIGTKGVVIFNETNPDNTLTGYWLGSIYDLQDTNQHIKTSKAPKLLNEKKTGGVIIGNANAGLAFKNSVVSVSRELSEMRQGSSSIRISQNGIVLNKDDTQTGQPHGTINIMPGRLDLITNGTITLNASNNFVFRNNGGSFSITGPLDPNYGKKKGDDRYKPVDTFFLKANKVLMTGGSGPFYMHGGSMNIKMAGNKITGGGLKPGKGSSTTFSVETIQGKLLLSTGDGDMDIICANNTKTDVLTIQCGTDTMPPKSKIELEATKMLLMSGLSKNSCKIELDGTGMSINMKVQQKISLEAQLNISLKAKSKIEISGKAGIKLESDAKIDVEAKANITLKAESTLDMSGSKMIKAGEKAVIQGTGPFCAIPTCPITGMAHGGGICQG